MNQFETLSEIIKSRRSIFPASYIDKEISDQTILAILENANWAPTHRKTEPWRFKVFRKDSLKALGEFTSSYYKENTPEDLFSEMKFKKTLNKPKKSACVIAICMNRDQEERVPEWEEEAAVACAVQNVWLSCTALGIGCYWSSPAAIHDTQEILNLKKGEKCMGFLFMGYMKEGEYKSDRGDVRDKIEWM